MSEFYFLYKPIRIGNMGGVLPTRYDKNTNLNTIDFITISILGDAQDFGDLMVSKRAFTATSDA